MQPLEGVKSSRLSDFYNGKYIFITGAAGFVGSLLLEVLLRCFPEIAGIYILLRCKKNLEPEERKKEIFKKKIMSKILKENPGLQDKVHVVSGDVTMPNLGMSEENLFKVSHQVTMVFHCASKVPFTETARYMAIQNCRGTDNVVELCRRLKHLHVLIYVSTAYSNCNYMPAKLEEAIYRLPLPAQSFLDELDNGNEESFNKMVSCCKPDWPNTYAFSKCLAENILQDKASDLPIAIIRPSIIYSVWKEPLPGYAEEGAGIVDLTTAIGKGLIRTLHADENIMFDVIPADIVVNSIVAAAWITATGKAFSPFVVNVTSGDTLRMNLGTFYKTLIQFSKKYQYPNGFLEPDGNIRKNVFVYWLFAIYEHYIPAAVLDAVQYLTGKQPKLLGLHDHANTLTAALSPLVLNTFDFETKNFKSLAAALPFQDRKIIYTDTTYLTPGDLFDNIPIGSPVFDWSRDKMSPEERKYDVYVYTSGVTFIKRTVLFLTCYLLYLIINKVFTMIH